MRTVVTATTILALMGLFVTVDHSSAESGARAVAPGAWQSLVRINAGGGAYVDSRGDQWAADSSAIGGTEHVVDHEIANTSDDALFQSERWGMSGYNIPLTNGSYVLRLYFAEVNPSSGARVINVSSGAQTLLSKFDVAAKVGDFTADVESFDVNVTAGSLPLRFSADTNSSSVAAIEVLRVTANSVYRMSAGDGNYKDTRGLTWAAEEGVTGSSGRVVSTDHDIDGTNDPALYQTQRSGVGGYKVSVADGTYILKLYLANITPATKRSFDVYQDDQQLFSDLGSSDDYAVDVQQTVVKVVGQHLNLRFVATEGESALSGLELLTPLSSDGQPNDELAPDPARSLDSDGQPAVGTTKASTTTSTVAKPRATTTTIAAPTSGSTGSAATPSMTGWKLVTSDDFNGTALTDRWGKYEGAGNEGVGLRDPATLSVANGELRITDHGNVGGGASFDYSSTYGRYVIRAKQDAGTGYGPAILLWPDSEKWPEDGEIDITEMPQGDRARSEFNVHYGADNQSVGHTTTGDFTQWHTWTLEWMPDHITLWVDGVLQTTVKTAAAIPDKPMHLALQNDVGADGHWIPARNSSTPANVALHVDYVQVYQQG